MVNIENEKKIPDICIIDVLEKIHKWNRKQYDFSNKNSTLQMERAHIVPI